VKQFGLFSAAENDLTARHRANTLKSLNLRCFFRDSLVSATSLVLTEKDSKG